MEVETLAIGKAASEQTSLADRHRGSSKATEKEERETRSRWTLVLAVMATAIVVQAAAYATRSASPYQANWLVDSAKNAPLLDAELLSVALEAEQARLTNMPASDQVSQALKLSIDQTEAPMVSISYAGKQLDGLATAETTARAIAAGYQTQLEAHLQTEIEAGRAKQAALLVEQHDLESAIASVRDEQYAAQVLAIESEQAKRRAQKEAEEATPDNTVTSSDQSNQESSSLVQTAFPATGLGPLFVVPFVEEAQSEIATSETNETGTTAEITPVASVPTPPSSEELAAELEELTAAKQAIAYQLEVSTVDLARAEQQPLPAPPRLVLRSKMDRGWVTWILSQAPLVLGIVLASATLALAPRKPKERRLDQRMVVTPLQITPRFDTETRQRAA